MVKLPFVNKQYWLIAGTALLLVICYQLAFKNTLQAWAVHRQLQQQLLQSADVSTEPAYIARKNNNLDQIIKTYRIDSVIFRNNVVNDIARLAEQEQVKLTVVPADDALYHTPRFIIQKLNFEGGFFPLLKLVDQLQNTPGIGMLRSIAFKTQKLSSGESAKKLNMEIYLEIYR
ncbi:MAG: hypothetical protein V4592_04840 [Bacteroidota bacterium]